MDFRVKFHLSSHIDEYIKLRSSKEVSGDESLDHYSIRWRRISYGTSGFRGQAVSVEHIFFNVGLISGLKCLLSKANIGIMITASHNPVEDNGVKLIEKNGEMLELEWEQIVEDFCNIHDKNMIIEQLEKLVIKYNINFNDDTVGQIFIGMDTRPSSEALVDLVKKGLNAWSIVKYVDYGLITTPALHYLVGESNKRSLLELALNTYYKQLIDGVIENFDHKSSTSSSTSGQEGQYSSAELVIDCANGVGYETMKFLLADDKFNKIFPIKLINIGGDGILNKNCGADHVKTIQTPPIGANDTKTRYASLDGDADRVVYFYLDPSENEEKCDFKLNLLDGDKILVLFAIYLKELLLKSDLFDELSFGCVQTAYANGASTDYLTKELKLQVEFADTGVKNLHRKALNFDIAIYFEANGHGTIMFSSKAKDKINNNDDVKYSLLKNLLKIINNYIGDAISDILVVETILKYYNWDVKKWYNIYHDRPNSLMKVLIPDRNKIKTINAGRTCLEPIGLQQAIDLKVSEFGLDARCFVRPSGTENVVRIYAEAKNQSSSDKLAQSVCQLVKEYCI